MSAEHDRLEAEAIKNGDEIFLMAVRMDRAAVAASNYAKSTGGPLKIGCRGDGVYIPTIPHDSTRDN